MAGTPDYLLDCLDLVTKPSVAESSLGGSGSPEAVHVNRIAGSSKTGTSSASASAKNAPSGIRPGN